MPPKTAVDGGDRHWIGLWLGGAVFIWALDESHTLYWAVFGFSYDNLRQAGPQRIGEQLLRYVMVVVSVVNVQALIVPVVALLAACSTLAPPVSGQPPDPTFYASQMKRLKDVLTAASAILVSGILHMGAWLRWPAALFLARRAEALLLDSTPHVTVPEPEQWLKDHGLFLSLQDNFPQFGLILAPLLASPLSSLLISPLSPTG